MDVLLSVPWTWNFGEPDPGAADGRRVRLVWRSQDLGLSRRRAAVLFLRDAWTLARSASRGDCVVLCTIGIEAAVAAALVKLVAPGSRVLVFDFLAPRRQIPGPLARLLPRWVDRFLVIRSGDRAMLARRFGVPSDVVHFLRWPVRQDAVDRSTGEDGYVYAAGWAHRDWDTLLAALARVEVPATLAPGRPLVLPPGAAETVGVIDMPSPEDGRELAARASVIAVVMADTDLPSGPLVLLDALGMGKAVVVTDVNGTRDYVEDGRTALVVPPADPEALAGALGRLMADPGLRRELGDAARQDVRTRNSVSAFWKGLLEQCH